MNPSFAFRLVRHSPRQMRVQNTKHRRSESHSCRGCIRSRRAKARISARSTVQSPAEPIASLSIGHPRGLIDLAFDRHREISVNQERENMNKSTNGDEFERQKVSELAALSAGSRVVVVTGYYQGLDEFIAGLRLQAQGSERKVIAKIVPAVNACYDPGQSEYSLVEADYLRRHALDFGFAFRVGDRVRIIADDGAQGSVIAIDVARDRILLARPQGQLYVHINQAVRVWQGGDLVRVRWGGKSEGLTDRVQINKVDNTHNVWTGERRFQVRAADIDFTVDIRRKVSYTVQLTESVQGGTYDNSRKYINMPVLVVKVGVSKGFRGRIIGDYDSEGRAQMLNILHNNVDPQRAREEERYHYGILLTVRKDNGENIQNIPIENVVHEATMQPLLLDNGLPRRELWSTSHTDSDTSQRHPPPRPDTPSAPSTSEPLWPANVKRWELQGQETADRDTNGDWLSVPGLKGKRLDVFVRGTKDVNTLPSRIREMEGKRGHLLLTEDVPLRSEKRGNIVKPAKNDKVLIYGATVGGSKHPIEPKYLRRCTINDSGQSVLDSKERVVVLGADITDNISRISHYGQTAPEIAHTNGPGIVAVTFLGGDMAFFPVEHLCFAKKHHNHLHGGFVGSYRV
ncbi:hypothetical protein R3P38DRAFT_2806458 [Favolaschia claudopus]|uniref:Uncharacterized protein n=1 Tax=Favolaschia claudopus TaxID=2862362 RepID=A0AAV9ZJT9_9AGAR